MSLAPDYFVFDGDGGSNAPRRPGVSDVGGAALVDDQAAPPDPETMPHATQLNQWMNLLVGYGLVAPAVIVSVSFSGGTPSKDVVVGIGFNVSASDVTLTDNGAGDTSVTLAAGKFPVKSWQAMGLTQNDDVEIDRLRAVTIANGVRVKSKLGAAATDCNFTVALSGR